MNFVKNYCNMTNEQIIDAGIDYTMTTRPVCIGGAAFEDMIRQYNRNPSFEAGATLAKEKIIEEACEWLCKNMTDSTYLGANTLLQFHKTDFIEQFKKAMEI